jgi:hypothetical protein
MPNPYAGIATRVARNPIHQIQTNNVHIGEFPCLPILLAFPYTLAMSRLLAFVSPLFVASLAIAQEATAEPPRPPSPGSPTEAPLLMMYLVLILVGALVVGSAFLASKRGHQD